MAWLAGLMYGLVQDAVSMQLAPVAEARLTAGDPVKNARAILRYALPIENTSARRVQVTLLAFLVPSTVTSCRMSRKLAVLKVHRSP